MAPGSGYSTQSCEANTLAQILQKCYNFPICHKRKTPNERNIQKPTQKRLVNKKQRDRHPTHKNSSNQPSQIRSTTSRTKKSPQRTTQKRPRLHQRTHHQPPNKLGNLETSKIQPIPIRLLLRQRNTQPHRPSRSSSTHRRRQSLLLVDKPRPQSSPKF